MKQLKPDGGQGGGLSGAVLPGAALILAAVLAVYFPSWRGGFLWDDDVMLTDNPLIQARDGLRWIWFSTRMPDYFPLTSTTFWLEWRLWGMNPSGYRLVNLLLHAGAAVLLWRVLRRLAVPGAWTAALLFAVHPVAAASAAWIAERKNTLSAVLALAGLLFFLRSRGFGPHRADDAPDGKVSAGGGLSLFLFAAALLSKTSVVALPVILLGCLWWRRGKLERRDVLQTAPYFALSLAAGLATLWFQHHRSSGGRTFDTLDASGKLAEAGRAVWFYAGKAVWPADLSMIHPWRAASGWTAWLPLLALAVIAAAGFAFRRGRGRTALFVTAAFAAVLFPVLGFFDMFFLLYSRTADHWNYLGLMIAVPAVVGSAAAGLEKTGSAWGRRAGIAAGGAAAVILGALTWQRAAVFADGERLWRDTLAKNPAAWVARVNLGNLLAVRGETAEAERLLLDAVGQYPDSAEAHYNLGNLRQAAGRLEEAADFYKNALRCRPLYPEAHYNLGLVFEQTGRTAEAMTHYQAALGIRPGHARSRNNLANLLARQGRLAEAAEHYRTVLYFQPDCAEACNNLANILSIENKPAEAAALYQKALALNPGYADARVNFGALLLGQGKPSEAAGQFELALRMRPDSASAHYRMAQARHLEGRTDDALRHLETALRLQPHFTEARELRARLGGAP